MEIKKQIKRWIMQTWSPASFTFSSAYLSCSIDSVMPVYLHPVLLTTSMAKVPHPHPISKTSWLFSILAWNVPLRLFKKREKSQVLVLNQENVLPYQSEERFSSSVQFSDPHHPTINMIIVNGWSQNHSKVRETEKRENPLKVFPWSPGILQRSKSWYHLRRNRKARCSVNEPNTEFDYELKTQSKHRDIREVEVQATYKVIVTRNVSTRLC